MHYIAGVCSALYLREAPRLGRQERWRHRRPNVAKGFYQKANWVPAGMEGVCNPSTWTEKDHRPNTTVDLYRSKISGATDGDINDVMAKGTIQARKGQDRRTAPRKADWFGW